MADDHWFVGFYSHKTGDRYHVVDGDGRMPRQNGFRHIQKIDEPIGRWFVENKDDIAGMATGIWDLLAMKINESYKTGGNQSVGSGERS